MRNFSIFEFSTFERFNLKLSDHKRYVGKLITLCLTAYFAMLGVTDISLLTSLQANNQNIRSQVNNFRAYIAGGGPTHHPR